MRSRAILAAVLLVGALVPATYARTGAGVAPRLQWAILNFERPTKVSTEILMGSYLVVHDEATMARGEPCTRIYPIETPGLGRDEPTVSFHCIPRTRPVVERFTIATEWDDALGMYSMKEYQFAGDAEGHGVPLAALAADQLRKRVSGVCARGAKARDSGRS